MDIITNKSHLKNELMDIMRLFFNENNEDIASVIVKGKRGFKNIIKYNNKKYVYKFKVDCAVFKDELLFKRYQKRYAKAALYKALSKALGESKSWGSLTGIRPTRLYYQLKNEENIFDVNEYFTQIFDVSEGKLALLNDVIANQSGYYNTDSRAVDIYVGIPFCVTRCSYCSFISAEIDKARYLVAPYIDALKKELSYAREIINANGLTVRSVYVGGGTPSSLSADELAEILPLCDFGVQEWTVECGRPDTITREKLQVIRDCGAKRISVNPQTFNQASLDAIGRKHSVESVKQAFVLANSLGFVINMDLIAGLQNECLQDFCASLNEAISFQPHNITVHSLCLKQGAKLKEQVQTIADNGVSEMVQYAYDRLKECGYEPYYMYRQKYMAGHNENVGYSKSGFQCIYNIDTMEENASVMAFGANAISKVYLGNGRIERQANAKDIVTYINNIDTLIEKKKKLFEERK